METRVEMENVADREELIDPCLKPMSPHEESAAFQVLEIALLCTKTAPQERPASRRVCDQLQHVYNPRTLDYEKKQTNPYA